jgi:hypothetical protein
LGLFGKSVLDETTVDVSGRGSLGDPVLFAGVAALILVGVLSSQLASSYYNEIVQSEKSSKDDSGEVEDGSIQDDIYNLFCRTFGLQLKQKINSEEAEKPNDDNVFEQAWHRVALVVDDEIKSVRSEIIAGQEVPSKAVSWDGKVLYTGVLSDFIPTSSMYPVYPGNRTVHTFEGGEDSSSITALLYTCESLLFSFVLFSKILNLNSVT